jgi:hypothetical protein
MLTITRANTNGDLLYASENERINKFFFKSCELKNLCEL